MRKHIAEYQVEINLLFIRSTNSVLCKKKSLRKQMTDYINGYKMMIHFEEEAQSQYLEEFNLKNVEITYHMDRQYYFPITVSFSVPIASTHSNDVCN